MRARTGLRGRLRILRGGAVSERLRYPCPLCGRWVTATASSLYATRRGGSWVRYVSLHTHRNPAGQPCPGAHASVAPPPAPGCSWSEGTSDDDAGSEWRGDLDGF